MLYYVICRAGLDTPVALRQEKHMGPLTMKWHSKHNQVHKFIVKHKLYFVNYILHRFFARF